MKFSNIIKILTSPEEDECPMMVSDIWEKSSSSSSEVSLEDAHSPEIMGNIHSDSTISRTFEAFYYLWIESDKLSIHDDAPEFSHSTENCFRILSSRSRFGEIFEYFPLILYLHSKIPLSGHM
jgi:hypothetical protein